MSQTPEALGLAPELTCGFDLFAKASLAAGCSPGGATSGQAPRSSRAAPLTSSAPLQVRESLPPTVRQHLDTGAVRVEVTGITNGSVVVEFNLLILADLDVQEVSAAFRSAFQNASLLEVAGGDIFIWGTWTPARGKRTGSGMRGSESPAAA